MTGTSNRATRDREYKMAKGDPRCQIIERAIAEAMDWNIRAYGKIACEEDAEFFAVSAMIALQKEEHQ